MTDTVYRTYADIRAALLAKAEIALIDVREEDPHAQSHPLFSANIPLAKLELEAYTRLPRLNVPIVVFDGGEGDAHLAAARLTQLGYTNVAELAGGLNAWQAAGGELFRDVNSASKAFGELVESKRHTPSLSAEEVQQRLQDKSDVVVLDARRFDEYQTMNIPGSVSVPGAELALRARALAPDPKTLVIVNCAGRTRSIIGTQSLVNAGIPNPVAALRNGTIGWTLAGQTLEKGSQRRFQITDGLSETTIAQSREAARSVADRAGVKRLTWQELEDWNADAQGTTHPDHYHLRDQAASRTTYRFDVRTPEEYLSGHPLGFLNAPGGQLVQETEMFAPVRGARIVLFDTDGVRANMTASWLAQMNNEVYVLDELVVSGSNEATHEARDARQSSATTIATIATTDTTAATATASRAVAGAARLTVTGPHQNTRPIPPSAPAITPQELDAALKNPGDAPLVIDVTSSANYVKAHIPGAWWILRSRLAENLRSLPDANRYVVTCGSDALARYVAPEVAALTGKPTAWLTGGNAGWLAAGLPTMSGEAALASPRIDRYRRPYEGTDASREAMNAYLEWEYGLVEQLGRDGTHGFFVI